MPKRSPAARNAAAWSRSDTFTESGGKLPSANAASMSRQCTTSLAAAVGSSWRQ